MNRVSKSLTQTDGAGAEFMLCFIGQPGTTTPAHMEIKQFGDNEFGVPTQCVSVSKLTGPKGNAKSRQ